MTSMELIYELIQVQNERFLTIERQLAVFKHPSTPKNSRFILERKIQIFDKLFEDFEATHTQLSGYTEKLGGNAYFEQFKFDKFLELYYEILSEINVALENIPKPIVEPAIIASSHSSVKTHAKLPPLTLPHFSGKYTEWTAFYDQFKAVIDDSTVIPPVQKLQHLLILLEGSAKDVIKHLPITSESYRPALELLIKRYANPRAIFINTMAQLFTLEKDKHENVDGLQRLSSALHEALQSFKTTGIDVDACSPMIAYMILEKLPLATRKDFEKQFGDSMALPNIEDVTKRIQKSLRTLELLETSKIDSSQNKEKNRQVKSNYFTKNEQKEKRIDNKSKSSVCNMCSEDHLVRLCPKFKEISVADRRVKAKEFGLCFNCLSNLHIKPNCTSNSSCFKCGQRHHTLLHLDNEEKPEPKIESKASTSKNMCTTICTTNIQTPLFRSTLLSTAIVPFLSKNEQWIPLRGLIDLGGEVSAMTESGVQVLNLKKYRTVTDVTHLDNTKSKSNFVVNLKMSSRINDFQTETCALVMKSLTSLLPSKQVMYSNWSHIKGIQLADPEFDKPGPIDFILGADVYADILCAEIIRGPIGTPVAQRTEFGWILFGHLNSTSKIPEKTVSMNLIQLKPLENLMEKFLQTEEIAEERKFTREEDYCYQFYKKHTFRDEKGIFVVKMPFRTVFDPSAILGKSRDIALRQFFQLEKRFSQNAQYKDDYTKNINDYLEQGHMVELFDSEEDRRYYTEDGKMAYDCYYMPHHAVVKEDKVTTNFRPVFNAGKISTNGNSLNSILFPGPPLQNDGVAVITNWRFHQIVFISDIKQMYRQIRIADEDITYHRILWRNNTNEKIREYGMNRVTFGVNYSPCGAIQTIHELAEQNQQKFPIVAEIMKKDFYMDDCTSGAADVNQAIQIQHDLSQIFDSAGFLLRKWASNSTQFMEQIPAENRNPNKSISLIPDDSIKTLGILWNPLLDTIGFKITIDDSKIITKRSVLSIIAKIYDPLGLLAPVIILAKIFIKKLWNLKFDWDDELPQLIQQEWIKLIENILVLNDITIPRWFHTSPNMKFLQIHGFADASTHGYGAMIYLRVTNNDETGISSLIISKAKVAPMKLQTIPRLELSAAVILAKLVKYVRRIFRHHQFEKEQIFLWSDSEIVLHWLRGDPNKYQVFVANRIIQILENSYIDQWRHIDSKNNPADLLSRGLTPNEFQQNTMWFSGPSWLSLPQNEWPKSTSKEILEETKHEMKTKFVLISKIESSPTETLLNYCSDFIKLQRITSWYRRFFEFLHFKSTKGIMTVSTEPLSIQELKASTIKWVLFIQKKDLSEEINLIRENKQRMKRNNQLWKLNPFLDNNQVLRVGGRLEYSSMPFEEKHPAILPSRNHFSNLLIKYCHECVLHGGTQLTLSKIRFQYWIIGGRKPIRKIISQCVRCFRVKPNTETPIMANLPPARVNQCTRPFLNTGVDLCGPIMIRLTKTKGSRVMKGYIALFICMAIKAVHIEPVVDLSSEAFLMAYHRFVSRRGLCQVLFADQGTNFIGARKMMSQDEIKYLEQIHSELNNKMANIGTRFQFNPPSAPSFGGIWESNIRRIKHHLLRMMQDRSLPYDELTTLLSKIEAILNSRPLLPMSDDSNDFSYLTPGHFLIGQSFNAIPEPNLMDTKISLSNYYRIIQQKVQSFWKIWKKDYLQSLQERQKWKFKEQNLQIGDIVLIKDDRLPPLKWLMGRITKVHPSPDGIIRVCTVKTQYSEYTRPVIKLALFPFEKEKMIDQIDLS